jgi:hypothetical protein
MLLLQSNSLLVTANNSQVKFGACLGPGFHWFWALSVCLEVTRTFAQASTRCLPFIPSGFLGFRGNTSSRNLPEKIRNHQTSPIKNIMHSSIVISTCDFLPSTVTLPETPPKLPQAYLANASPEPPPNLQKHSQQSSEIHMF